MSSPRLLSSLIILQMFYAQIVMGNKIANYSSLIPGFSSCHFEGYKYKINERFHPKAVFDGKVYEEICVDCKCNPTTMVQCERTVCPPIQCEDPIRLSGECCGRCPGENLSGIVLQDWSNQPKDCKLDGVIYEHGSSFHPPSSPLSRTDNIYCTVYSCNNGTLAYTDVSSTCPPIMACEESEAFYVNGSCCKVCPEVALEIGECKDELGNARKANETWNFYSTAYQMRLNCLNCSCKGSESYVCSRNPCPPVPLCTDKDEVEDVVVCCPKCSNKPPPTTEKPATNESVTAPVLEICSHTHKVFLCNATSMAIENVANRSVIMYVWLQSGVKQAYYYTSEEFQNLNCSNYQGGTIERRVNGLKNREQKRLKILNCKKDCAEMVVNMLRPEKDC